jgi:cytoskeletal protein RodZ
MSLINDALNKARESQPANSSAAEGPSFRRAETSVHNSAGKLSVNLLLGTLAVVVVLLAVLFFAQWYLINSAEVKVRAKAKPWETPDITIIKPPPVVHPPKESLPAMSPSGSSAQATSVSQPEATANNPFVSNITQAITNLKAAAQPLKAAETKYKLQSIFYRPGDAAAVINGNIVSIGERAAGALVLDITENSVTIVTPAGQTNKLELPQ